MHLNKIRIATAVAAAVMAGSASASLIYDASVQFSAQGFGNAPRALTLQSAGNATSESGCVSFAGGVINFGPSACTSESLVHDPNGTANTGGDEPPPLSDNQKYGAPTAGLLGISSADQIAILFNAAEPSGDRAHVTDITLNFWTSGGVLLGAIDGSFDFLDSQPGNGSAGFTFVVSADEQAYVNTLLTPTTVLTLNATIDSVSGGPETFAIARIGATGDPRQLPEPTSLALLGAAALAAVGLRRKSKRA